MSNAPKPTRLVFRGVVPPVFAKTAHLLLPLCETLHQGESLIYGENIAHVDSDMQEIMRTDLVTAQDGEMAVFIKLLKQVREQQIICPPEEDYLALVRALTVVRFRIHAQHFDGISAESLHTDEVSQALKPEQFPYFLWFHLCSDIQHEICGRLLG
jgi:hypothetical protein